MERILVTGATGFLGGQVARRFVGEGAAVTGLGRNPEAGAALRAAGVNVVLVDLCDRHALLPLFANIDVVVHCAARSSPWGSQQAFERDNVVATEHVLAAATQAGVGRLVHISTPSIYHNGHDLWNVVEGAALPARAVNAYAQSKRQAEERVDSALGLHRVTLRPRALFGPGDQSVLPRIIRALRTGRLPMLGRGDNLVDVTYIDNAVDAVVLAARRSVSASAKYNISNGEPINLWAFIHHLARTLGLPPPRGRMSRSVATLLAGMLEDLHRRFRPEREPFLTRYGVDLLTLTTTLDISRAQRELGYRPRVRVLDGLERFAAHWLENGRV